MNILIRCSLIHRYILDYIHELLYIGIVPTYISLHTVSVIRYNW